MPEERATELIIERLTNRVDEANTLFLKEMGAVIKKIKELTPSEAHKLVQMLKYGDNYDKIVKQISKYTDLNVRDIDEIFANYAKKDLNFSQNFYRYRNIPFTPYEQNTAIKMQTEALAQVVKNQVYNFSRSNVLGYSVKDDQGNLLFEGLKQTYNDLLDTALMNVSQGKETFDSSMSRIMQSIGESGLKTLDFESGRSIRLDSAIRMHLRGKLRELQNENQKLIGDQIDFDGWEISVHENPALDHQDAQGRQFRIDEYEKLQTIGVAKDYKGKEINLHLDRKTTQSTAVSFRPISEYNCYHIATAIVLGVSEPRYTDKQLQEIIDRNNKGFDFEGKHYTMYEGSQLQRQIETEIRKQKDLQIFAKSADNQELIAKSQGKITALLNKYDKLNKASGLKPKLNRLRVEGYRKVKINEPIPSKPKNTANVKEVFISKEENEKLANIWIDYYAEYSNNKFAHLRDFEQERYNRLLEQKKDGFKDETIRLDSIENCNKLLEKVNTEIRGDEIRNTDFRLVQEATESLYNNTKKSPAVLDELKSNRAWLKAEKNTSGVANTQFNTITLNNQYYSNYDEFLKMAQDNSELHDYADGKKHSWWGLVAKGNETKQVIVHEFGHRLQTDIAFKARYSQENKAFDFFYNKYGYLSEYGNKMLTIDPKRIERELIYEPIRRLANKEHLTQKEIIDKYVSMYGKKSYSEMFAEVFANSQLGQSNALGDELINFLIELGEWE